MQNIPVLMKKTSILPDRRLDLAALFVRVANSGSRVRVRAESKAASTAEHRFTRPTHPAFYSKAHLLDLHHENTS